MPGCPTWSVRLSQDPIRPKINGADPGSVSRGLITGMNVYDWRWPLDSLRTLSCTC